MNRSRDKKPPIARVSSKDKKFNPEDFLKKAVEQLAKQPREKSPKLVKEATVDNGLMTSLLKRVSLLEQQTDSLKKDLRAKTLHNAELSEALEIAKKASSPDSISHIEELKVFSCEPERKL